MEVFYLKNIEFIIIVYFIIPIIVVIKDRIMINTKAGKNPSILNPGIIAAAIAKIITLIMIEKSPKVRILIGKVRMTKIGLTKAFKTDKTKATTTLVAKEFTLTPGTT